jgi:hypothetical protein
MVTRIKMPKQVDTPVYYNEIKCAKGKAECIATANALLLPKENASTKIACLQDRISLNKRASTKLIHMSVNFHPDDVLDKEKLITITTDFMQRIGYGEQPYFVYQHFDAGHPHVHVVTTTIRADGSRIDTHNMGRDQVNKARQAIEKEYRLTVAKGRSTALKPIGTPTKKLHYGTDETLHAITKVLSEILPHYNYTSLNELNAVLRLYNVEADRGDEQGRIYKTGGLTYHALDEKGKPLGVPVKASAMKIEASLKFLEQRFAKNKLRKLHVKQKIRTVIDWHFKTNPANIEALAAQLKKQNIVMVIRRSEQNTLYGITYVDLTDKAVFKGSDLGKDYAAQGLQKRLAASDPSPHRIRMENEPEFEQSTNELLHILFDPIKDEEPLPYELIQDRKKRKRKKIQ